MPRGLLRIPHHYILLNCIRFFSLRLIINLYFYKNIFKVSYKYRIIFTYRKLFEHQKELPHVHSNPHNVQHPLGRETNPFIFHFFLCDLRFLDSTFCKYLLLVDWLEFSHNPIVQGLSFYVSILLYPRYSLSQRINYDCSFSMHKYHHLIFDILHLATDLINIHLNSPYHETNTHYHKSMYQSEGWKNSWVYKRSPNLPNWNVQHSQWNFQHC